MLPACPRARSPTVWHVRVVSQFVIATNSFRRRTNFFDGDKDQDQHQPPPSNGIGLLLLESCFVVPCICVAHCHVVMILILLPSQLLLPIPPQHPWMSTQLLDKAVKQAVGRPLSVEFELWFPLVFSLRVSNRCRHLRSCQTLVNTISGVNFCRRDPPPHTSWVGFFEIERPRLQDATPSSRSWFIIMTWRHRSDFRTSPFSCHSILWTQARSFCTAFCGLELFFS